MTANAAYRHDDDAEMIEATARDWARRLAGGGDVDEAAFQAWRDSDPRHEEAFWEAWRVWQAVGPVAATDESWRDEAAALMDSPKARVLRFVRSRPVRFGIPTALAASVAAAIALSTIGYDQPTLSVATPVGSTRVVALEDGSRITLGARSAVTAYISGDERRVELADGQAFFEVAHDPSRPFIVEAGDAEIRVTGTKFDVRRVGGDVQVSVLEGRVEVRRRGALSILTSRAPEQVLTAGRTSELQPGQGFGPSEAVRITPGEWRTGRLYYADAPLGDILADAERYSGRSLRAADGQIAQMRLTASFRPGNIEGLIENVQAAVPLVAQRGPDGSIVFARRSN